jgi:hypothetical protein
MPRMCLATHLLDPRLERNNEYFADAEVDLKFASGVEERLKQPGTLFDFKVQRNWQATAPSGPEHWVGHFDFESPVAGAGWPRATGTLAFAFTT